VTRWVRRGVVVSALVMVLGWMSIPLPDPPFPEDYGSVVLDANGEVLHTYLSEDEQWRFRLEANGYSEKLTAAVVTAEDRRFRSHPGVDVLSLARAVIQNARAGEVRSGASTLTMQVARLMRPKPRTVPNKILEMLQAVKLETRYSKDELLRLWLEHAPYGGNVVGAAAAGLHYFGRPPTRLTWAEAATLAVLPRSPSRITPFRNPELLLERRNRLLEALHTAGEIDQATLSESLRERLPERAFEMPVLAPHLSRRVAAASPGLRVRTTLDRETQEALEALARRHGRWLGRQGIHNLAVLAVETTTGAVRGYVGSADFFDDTHGGQVDGVLAPRSTGSILKPFLYAQAFDSGVIHPESLLRDVPIYFGSYAPVNADHRFSGMVRARDALVRSLNVPPTILLDRVGVTEFHHLLRRAGMTTLFRSPSEYGLSLILGGAEGTLWDIVGLYRGLAREGRFAGLTTVPGHECETGPQLLSPGASHTTLEILTEVRRPDDDGVDRTLFSPRRRVAWKTGTSFGKRDAWAVGVTPDWVLGVWVGNFSGKGNAAIGGAAAAAPILFAALELLPGHADGGWFPEARDVRSILLCSDSGYRAGPDCPSVRIRPHAAHAPLPPQCRYHRGFWIDPETGYEVCSRCWQSTTPIRDVRLILPPDSAQLMRRAGRPVDSSPPHNPQCRVNGGDHPLRVVYPGTGTTLLVPRDVDGKVERVTLRAAHTSADAALYWYVDGKFEGRTRTDHALSLVLTAGNHRVEVVDQDGGAAHSLFRVERRDKVG
jgi:penicillin-binding protein 1C